MTVTELLLSGFDVSLYESWCEPCILGDQVYTDSDLNNVRFILIRIFGPRIGSINCFPSKQRSSVGLRLTVVNIERLFEYEETAQLVGAGNSFMLTKVE